MLDYFQIGQRIREKREAFHWSRDYLAEKLEITPKFCADIELGVKGFSLKTLDRLSEVLGLTTDYILFGVEADRYANTLHLLNSCDEKNYHMLRMLSAY